MIVVASGVADDSAGCYCFDADVLFCKGATCGVAL